MRLEYKLNYYGVLFHNCNWNEICSCCIVAPDCSFCWHYEEDYDEILVLWKEDKKPCSAPRRRLYLNTILSALAILLYSKISSRVEYTIVHLNGNQASDRVMPPINLSLWGSLFGIGRYSFKYIQNINELSENANPVALKSPPQDIFKNANELWENFVYEKIRCFFSSIDGSERYLLLRPIIVEWLTYYYEFPTIELEVLREKMLFQPWYADVLKTIPHINPLGLIIIELPSIEHYALYDYYPEQNRSFICIKDEKIEALWHIELCIEHSENISLPHEKDKNLHLLPKHVANATFPFSIENVPRSYFYDERWLGNNYVWDR